MFIYAFNLPKDLTLAHLSDTGGGKLLRKIRVAEDHLSPSRSNYRM